MNNEPQKRVLVVDDDASICELLSSVLQQYGLLDLIMPVLDGFAVLDRMDDEAARF